MTITVNAIKRATIKLGRDATVLQLLQALTENLGGEWDDATLTVMAGGPTGSTFDDGWTLIASIEESGPARPERWMTGEHVAVPISAVAGAQVIRKCSCGEVGNEDQMAQHLTLEATRWRST